jgi:hypothetical protein
LIVELIEEGEPHGPVAGSAAGSAGILAGIILPVGAMKRIWTVVILAGWCLAQVACTRDANKRVVRHEILLPMSPDWGEFEEDPGFERRNGTLVALALEPGPEGVQVRRIAAQQGEVWRARIKGTEARWYAGPTLDLTWWEVMHEARKNRASRPPVVSLDAALAPAPGEDAGGSRCLLVDLLIAPDLPIGLLLPFRERLLGRPEVAVADPGNSGAHRSGCPPVRFRFENEVCFRFDSGVPVVLMTLHRTGEIEIDLPWSVHAEACALQDPARRLAFALEHHADRGRTEHHIFGCRLHVATDPEAPWSALHRVLEAAAEAWIRHLVVTWPAPGG